MLVTLTPNPCVDKTLYLEEIALGSFMRAGRCTCVAGGKGVNVARAARRLGLESTAVTLVGGAPGRHVVEMIEGQDGGVCAPVWIAGMTRTITTVVEEATGRQTAFFEPGPAVTEAEGAALAAQFSRALADGARWATLNGTAPDPSLAAWLYPACIRAAREAGVPVLLDAHGPEFAAGVAAGPDMVKPNLAEAAEWFGAPLPDEESRLRAIDAFHAAGVRRVLLSLGAEGMIASEAGARWRVRPPAITERNPVGSGDACVAGVLAALAQDADFGTALAWGAAAGAANARTWEIGAFDRGDVEELLRGAEVARF